MARPYIIPKHHLRKMKAKLQRGEQLSVYEGVEVLSAFEALRTVFRQQCTLAFSHGVKRRALSKVLAKLPVAEG